MKRTKNLNKYPTERLSKREYRYRCKLIAENHFKKYQQKYLDIYIRRTKQTYRQLYLDKIKLHLFLGSLLMIKNADAFETFSRAIRGFSKSFKEISEVINKLDAHSIEEV